jgi:serine/threonine protein kinase/Flp pilus assembly protein TadD
MNEPYLETLESLVARVADEFRERQKAGEPPDVEEYVARHPEAAATLRPVLVMLALAGPALSGVTGGEAVSEDGVSGTLGDFRIVREVGRGGMGVVYEAEQISLRRRVALKVLPLAATMDPRRLQRFRNEAYAAASLHHEHIVPVHAVGCERGLHFYAMQFVEGRTLAQVICTRRAAAGHAAGDDELTQPYRGARPSAETAAALSTVEQEKGKAYYREVARLGIEAALALEHAHALGIVHRDMKPGNLMLDGWGKLWVADFGLARLGGEPGVTMTGDLVGTLRYMSPEQAMARHGLVDHRTDVYSLGATLYELLTLRPAVGGKDRQEVLRHIAFEEPTAPQQVDPTIPADLDTVVLKAMAKNPHERYASAKELADDLQRFLEDKPIKARRPGPVQRLAKLARRHRAVAATAVAGLALVLAVLAGSVGWAAGERRARWAESSRVVAAALGEAREWLRKDRPHEALSAALRAEGMLRQAGGYPESQTQVAEMLWDVRLLLRLERARLSYSAARDASFDAPAADEDYEKAFTEFGLDLLNLPIAQAAEPLQDREIRVELAAFLDHWAVVRHEARGSQSPDWKQLHQLARQIDPDEGRERVRDALARRDWKALGRLAEAGGLAGVGAVSLTALLKDASVELAVLPQVEAVLRRAQQGRPADYWLNMELASALRHQRPAKMEEAIGFYRAAVAVRPESPGGHIQLGNALAHIGRQDEAVACFQRVIHIKPDDVSGHCNLGNLLRDKGLLDEAIACFQRAIDFKPDNADVYNSLGTALHKKGRMEEAIALYRKAIDLRPSYADAQSNLGAALRAIGKLDEAIACYRLLLRLRPNYANAHYNLGIALAMKGGSEEAIACYRRAIDPKPDHAEAHCNLGQDLRRQGRFDEALPHLRRGHELGTARHDWRYPSASWVRRCQQLVELDRQLTAILAGERRPGSPREAIECAELCARFRSRHVEAVQLYKAALDAAPELNDPPHPHRYNAACAAALAGSGKGLDGADLDAAAKGRLRRQARDWLKAELSALAQLWRTNPKAAASVRGTLAHWRRDADLASIRDEAALAKLDADERQGWSHLWAEVDRVSKAIGGPGTPAKK